MPSLAKIARMTGCKVYKVLSKLPMSMYVGVAPSMIQEFINKNDALRYLTELALGNERNRSDLQLVSE